LLHQLHHPEACLFTIGVVTIPITKTVEVGDIKAINYHQNVVQVARQVHKQLKHKKFLFISSHSLIDYVCLSTLLLLIPAVAAYVTGMLDICTHAIMMMVVSLRYHRSYEQNETLYDIYLLTFRVCGFYYFIRMILAFSNFPDIFNLVVACVIIVCVNQQNKNRRKSLLRSATYELYCVFVHCCMIYMHIWSFWCIQNRNE
jgi:hypothetical protein